MEEILYSQIRYWIDDLPRYGRRTFSLDDAIRQFPNKSYSGIKNALSRGARAGKIQSVWRGFYAIVLPEYGARGIVPPTEYISQLMSFIGSEYYVALLSAAQQWGAAHQSPQVFQFICDKPLRNKVKNHVKLEPVLKGNIPKKYLMPLNVRSGRIQVSSPELTAVDLVLYHYRAGGLNIIATILSDLCESLDFQKVDQDFFESVPPATIQRLGYLLDDIVYETEVADSLFEKAKDSGIWFRKALLQTGKNNIKQENRFNERWKIIINTDVEADI